MSVVCFFSLILITPSSPLLFAEENISTVSKETQDKVVENIQIYLANDATLSNSARAIVVSGREGIITLKGDVVSEVERNRVTLRAQQIAGSYKIDAQLQIIKR